MDIEPDEALLRDLHEHNPWWEVGVDAFDLPARQKSDFYHLARPDATGSQVEEQFLLALTGRRGAGKTTLVHEFIRHRIEAGDPPELFLYLPFDADPLYQLQSAAQLRRAVRYYETRILGRIDTDRPQFVVLDDVHHVGHPNKPSTDGWERPVADLYADDADRHVLATASADIQIERPLADGPLPADAYDTQPTLPEKFRDYVFALRPALERDDRRVSPTSLRTGDGSIPRALETGDVAPLVAELRGKYEQIADVADWLRSQVVEYLAMGGIISYDQNGAVATTTDLPAGAYDRLRDDVRDALYQEVPGFESIQTLADLERLCAIAARNRGADPIRYQDLVELFDVDRRTIADSYLPALAELYLLNGVTEYDNSRPRAVRLYLQDTGLVTALTGGDAAAVRNDFDREADLARIAAFDHTMRLAYNVAAQQGRSWDPPIQYWRGRDGEVDFVFEVGDTPVPVGLGYRPSRAGDRREAVREFVDEYETPLGFLLVGETGRGDEPVTVVDDGILRLPYWLYLLVC